MLKLELATQQQVDGFLAELGTDETQIKQDIQTIIEWISKQPHLPKLKDERRIRNTLIFCKNSLEKTKHTLDMYYTLRSLVPEFYGNRDPLIPELLACMDVGMFIPTPKLTDDGYRVSIFRFDDVTASRFNINDFIKICFMSIDIRVNEDNCKGDILVYDFKGGSLAHMTQVLPLIRKIIYCGINSIPMRHKSAHILNLPSFGESFISVAKGLLSKKLADRTFAHPVQDLLKYIPAQSLPKDYGGSDPMTFAEIKQGWIEKLKSYRGWFLKENDIKSDEKKRIGKRKTIDQAEVFGLEGSFRKINVD